jgi:hypothetical protein
MGSRVYTVPIENVSIGTAVQDVFSLVAGAAGGIIIHHIHLEAAVSAESALRMRLKRGTATVTQGSGGTVVTPPPVSQNDAAAANVTAHINDTTQATTTGAFTTLAGFNWDTALPFDHLPAPEDREDCAASSCLILDLPAVLSAAVTVSGYFKYQLVP